MLSGDLELYYKTIPKTRTVYRSDFKACTKSQNASVEDMLSQGRF